MGLGDLVQAHHDDERGLDGADHHLPQLVRAVLVASDTRRDCVALGPSKPKEFRVVVGRVVLARVHQLVVQA